MARKRLTRSQKSAKSARAREAKAAEGKLTDEEKRARRQDHAELIKDALEALDYQEGMRAFLQTREINPQLTPLGAALVAHQAPGEVVGSMTDWKKGGYRVRKGETARAYTTAPGFWPKPMFVLAQTDAPTDWEDAALDGAADIGAQFLEALTVSIRRAFAEAGRKTATLNAWTEEIA